MSRISTFDDWITMLDEWRRDIGLDRELVDRFMPGYQFEAKYGELPTPEIYFGDFKGDRRWEKVREIPDQRMRDAVLNMVVYQGDTEFASNEQQRFLVNNAPSEYDLASLVRIMVEETRHGYQMCHLMVDHFGSEGKIEAQKMLERRAFGKKNRLLNAFNDDVTHWLDFFAYTNFMDRDGKFQLSMLSHSSFAPLAASMGPMLREEAFHMGTGITGLRRIAKAGVIPVEIQQKYYNKWISGSMDLFGTDHSGSAQWAYTWGIKGRVDEDKTADSVRQGAPQRARAHAVLRGGLWRRSRASTKSIRARRSFTCPTCASTARSATSPASAMPSTDASSLRPNGRPMRRRCSRPRPTRRRSTSFSRTPTGSRRKETWHEYDGQWSRPANPVRTRGAFVRWASASSTIGKTGT